MNKQTQYDAILSATHVLALATSVDGIPNVRLVNVVRMPGQAHILLFASHRNNRKVEEFPKNSAVAFTTVPSEGVAHVRSLDAMVRPSTLTIAEAAPLFLKQIPGYDEALRAIGEHLDVYEILIRTATITQGMSGCEEITVSRES